MRLLFILTFAICLAACSKLPPMQSATAAPSERTQCANIRHQMLFDASSQHNQLDSERQMDRVSLEENFKNLDCDKVLAKSS